MALFVFVCPFQKLVNEVGKRLQSEAASKIPVQTKVLLTVWTLSNQETFRQIGDRFDLDRGNVHAHYVQVCNCIQLSNNVNFMKHTQ